jgi:hypothetical protein
MKEKVVKLHLVARFPGEREVKEMFEWEESEGGLRAEV